jgi:uncharacterized protein (DUF608 family)
MMRSRYNGTYKGDRLNHVAFPMGGIGAGTICLEGTGALSHVSIRNRPEIFNEPCVFSALCVKGEMNVAHVLEGPVPPWKLFGIPEAGKGLGGRTYGLPRFWSAEFSTRFPFATVTLKDARIPVTVHITGWSPFTPGDADSSSLPVAALEYRFASSSMKDIEAVFSFNATNFLASDSGTDSAQPADGGFTFHQTGSRKEPWKKGWLRAEVDGRNATVDCGWFRGSWFDSLTLAWKKIAEGRCEATPAPKGAPSPGASIFVPFTLKANQEETITLRLCWYFPESNVRAGKDGKAKKSRGSCYRPWYAGRFKGIDAAADFWRDNYSNLREESERFSDCFYDTHLPPEVIEAVAANLSILKSPTVLRQTDGRLWGWEGCGDSDGSCFGSCAHVWNYAQALPHLFPDLERTLRETELLVSQDRRGHQAFRSGLPIRPVAHEGHAAADGQLGGIMKIYREWRISGDTGWIRKLWPKIAKSLDYCIRTWDPKREGILTEPHHNTYDIEFWGPDGMCGSIYLGALRAAVEMGKALAKKVSDYQKLYEKGRRFLEKELFNGEYFFQQVRWKDLKAGDPAKKPGLSREVKSLVKEEGPRYQYGSGCLSDGVIGTWLAAVCGMDEILDGAKVKSHLHAVHRYNFRRSLMQHANPQRPGYAVGNEGGLLLCSWPKGSQLTIPFPYSNEVWTGIEYQVASHLMMQGMVREGLEIVRAARDRYDGVVRNPFNEYECGHWYARAMSSYALLQALTGVRYDAVDKTLYMDPKIIGDFRVFLSTAGGYGTAGVKDDQPFVEVKKGSIPIRNMVLRGRGHTPSREET